MSTSPITVTSDTELMHVINMFVEKDISGLPVVDDNGRLVGFVTERDCIRGALQLGYFDEVGDSIKNYMIKEMEVAHPDDSLMDVGELFANSPFRRCPVVEDDKLVGLISRRDILRALSEGAWFAKG